MEEFTVLQQMFDNDDLVAIDLIESNRLIIELLYSLIMPRDAVPRIRYFAEETVPSFSSHDFRTHFRIDHSTFQVILEGVAPLLTSNNPGGKDQIDVEKQLQIFIWYIANQESMREVSNLFGISISTVHGIVMRVCRHFNTAYQNVCISAGRHDLHM